VPKPVFHVSLGGLTAEPRAGACSISITDIQVDPVFPKGLGRPIPTSPLQVPVPRIWGWEVSCKIFSIVDPSFIETFRQRTGMTAEEH
jgi:hypothetical protein